MAITVCAFNVNNLFVRYKFGSKFPGDMGTKSLVGEDWGYLPAYQKGLFELFSKEQRELAAKVIRRGTAKKYPDVLCLVEVESMLATPFPRFAGVDHTQAASDHAAIFFEVAS